MAKMKVHEIAKEYNVQSKDIVNFLMEKGIDKKAASNMEENEISLVRSKFGKTETKRNVTEAQMKQTPAQTQIKKDDSRPVQQNGKGAVKEGRPIPQSQATKQGVTENRPIKPGMKSAVGAQRPGTVRPGAPAAGTNAPLAQGVQRQGQGMQRPAGPNGQRPANPNGFRPSNKPIIPTDKRPTSSYVADGYRPVKSDRVPYSERVIIPADKKPTSSYRADQPSKPVQPAAPSVAAPAAPTPIPAVQKTTESQEQVQKPQVQQIIKSMDEMHIVQPTDNVYKTVPQKSENNVHAAGSTNNGNQTGERRPYQGNQTGERRPYQGNQTGERRPYQGAQNNQNGQRPYGQGGQRPYGQSGQGGYSQGGQRSYGQNNQGGQGGQGGQRSYGQGGQGGYNQGGQRPYNQGGQRPYSQNGQGGQGGQRPYGQGGQGTQRPYGQGGQGGQRPAYGNRGGAPFNKDAFDKDAPQYTRGSNERRRTDGKVGEKSTIKSELAKELTKEQRAAAFNDRSRDKNKGRGRVNEADDTIKSGKGKKDPNRKGAFIMPKPQIVQEVEDDGIKTIVIPEVITIKELADKMKKVPSVIVKKLFLEGKMVSINQEITFEEAEEIAIEYDCIVEKEVQIDVVEELMKEDDDPVETLEKRPPVVCVMGHVDHGKTSLLDAIRETNVTAREAGGITQHIGAYVVEINGQKITFLDTPGHEAFTSMRMRGAKSTDIAILVVAADDGVMPQTVEAINHAKAAGVQIIIAVNKMDKPSANMERVKQELTEHSLVAEDWGGDTVFVPVSAKTGQGIEQLLEMILLTAELCELKANPNRNARGIVIEAELDKGRGPVATVLVQKGTLRVGDNIVIGAAFGKVRAMMDDKGHRVKEATPSTPVEVIGLNEVPGAGDIFIATDNEKEARTISSAFISQGRERLLADTKAKLSLDGLFSQIKAGNIKELNLIIKADVQGSVEAMKQSLLKLSNDEVAVRVIHGGVGAINESDVSLASASNAIIIGFNVRPDNTAKEISEREKVDVKLYRVIYNAIEDVEAAMKGMLDPIFEEKVIAHAEIRQVFKASGLGSIAGSYVLDGKIVRNCSARITREGTQIFEGPVASLKRMKEDVKEVATGYECGIVFEKFNDLAEFDLIEFYIMVEVPR